MPESINSDVGEKLNFKTTKIQEEAAKTRETSGHQWRLLCQTSSFSKVIFVLGHTRNDKHEYIIANFLEKSTDKTMKT